MLNIITSTRKIFNKVVMIIYAFFLANLSGHKLKKTASHIQKKKIRLEFSEKFFLKLGIEVKVKNAHNLPKEGQFLLVSNHRSMIDPLVVEIALKESNIFGLWVSKKELNKIPFLSTFFKYAGTIPLDRESKSVTDSFKAVKANVRNGDSIFIFPEGTRNRKGTQLATFKKGTQMIALKNRLPILPVYIRTKADKAFTSALKGKPETIEIEIGELIDYKTRLGLEEVYRSRFKLESISLEE